MAKGGPLTDEEVALLKQAWPDRSVASEIAILRALPPLRRQKSLARLKALLKIEDARRGRQTAQIDLKSIAAEAGLTPNGLFSIRQKWAESQTLAAIVPYLERNERQPTQRDEKDPVVVAARELILNKADVSDTVLANMLRRDFPLSPPVLVRLVRRLRRDDATDPKRVGKVFGKAILIDLCAIDRVAMGETPQMIVCAVVVERATGLILGHEAEIANGDTLQAQAKALTRARAWIREYRLDQREGQATAAVTLADGLGFEDALAAAEALKQRGVDLAINSVGPRRYGTRLVSLLGKRLGRLWWRPRSTAPGAEPPISGSGPEMRIDDARILVAAEVARHNAEVMARLAEGGITRDWGVEEGAMVAAIDVVADVLAGKVNRGAGRSRRG